MQCPNCASDVPAQPFCASCGAPLFPSAIAGVAPSPTLTNADIPLTPMQRLWLIGGCLPVVFFVLAFAFAATLLDNLTGAPPPPLLLALLGLVILVTGYQAFQRLRDLLAGAALVREDLLERTRRSRQRGSLCYGTFAQLGRLRMRPKVYIQAQPGRRYQLVYSPHSKMIWSLTPVHQYY